MTSHSDGTIGAGGKVSSSQVQQIEEMQRVVDEKKQRLTALQEELRTEATAARKAGRITESQYQVLLKKIEEGSSVLDNIVHSK